MAENKLTDTITTSPTQLVTEEQTETLETEVTKTPDFVPLHTTSKPKIIENSTVPNEKKNGNGLEKNGQKRIQAVPIIDGTSKKPRINTPEDSSSKKVADEIEIRKEGGEEDMDQSSDMEEYYLTVHNLPTDWTYVQIKNYMDQECGHVDEMEMLKHRKSKNCAIRLTFQSLEKCTEVFKKLENKYVQDKKLKVKISDTYTTFPTGVTVHEKNSIKPFTISNEIIAATRWRPDLDSWDVDPEGLYGLRPEFLDSLNIKPPLSKMVNVTNFRCDKSELREVLEMAGNVLMCCVVATAAKYAKVMYSHPLEAVQAISMLNGQLFYGTPLKITMEKNLSDSIVLPKGLANIGQGLGLKARPIRNIVHQYHRYAKKQGSQINPILFSKMDFTNEHNIFNVEENTEEIKKKIKEFLSVRPGCNIINPTVRVNINDLEGPDDSDTSVSETKVSKNNKNANKKSGMASPEDSTKKLPEKPQNSPQQAAPTLSSGPPHPLVRMQNQTGFVRPNLPLNPPVPMNNPPPMPGPCEPFFGPGNMQPEPIPFRPRVPFMAPPIQRPPFPQPRPPFGPPPGMRPPIPPNFNGPRANIGNRVSVQFSNLPPSTTFPLLCDQLAQCGQVMSVQLTTPGCAVATFGHPSHAERCFHNFNGKNVEGFVIEVGFI